ncbi:efflux RND transporter periplasmic adaptor subunit [Marinobacter sp. Arc7-DN-1]|uniref:efflux RND transporter periplasmic adaptor subunit n=1 Tax=Marinobacter sp. Arc7-DN-1 TaxID=2304594 RepID=UPI0013C2E603|nr:efflux RND transporter periplasmic adaptor subunit [Marinobacter sp. Arc7-DN-1]
MNKPLATLFFLLIPALAPAAELVLTQQQLASAQLATTTVTARELKPRLGLTATLTADRRKSHRVTPVVDGLVTELLMVENDTVHKGQVLARLRSNSLGQAQADYLEALARFDLARAERARIEGLWKDGIVAESRWLAVDSEYKRARATLDARRRLLSLAGLSDDQIQALAQKPDRLAEFELISPIDGMVTGVEIESGQLATAGQAAFHVDDLSSLWAEVRVPVASLPRIELGAEVLIQVEASPGREYRGRLQSLGGEVERQSQTLGGRIVVDNPDDVLRPGMYAAVTLTGISYQGLVVPASAVFRVGEQAYLFEVTGPRRFKPVPIEIGTEAGDWIAVRAGIAADTEIVSGGVAELKSHWQYQGGE